MSEPARRGRRLRAAYTTPTAASVAQFVAAHYGYLAYDLAVHLWPQVSFGRQRYVMWHAFTEGYRSVRPIAPVDFEAVHLFVPIRHIWLMGGYAEHVSEWGTENVPPAWLDRQANFLRSWETEKLSAGLF